MALDGLNWISRAYSEYGGICGWEEGGGRDGWMEGWGLGVVMVVVVMVVIMFITELMMNGKFLERFDYIILIPIRLFELAVLHTCIHMFFLILTHQLTHSLSIDQIKE